MKVELVEGTATSTHDAKSREDDAPALAHALIFYLSKDDLSSLFDFCPLLKRIALHIEPFNSGHPERHLWNAVFQEAVWDSGIALAQLAHLEKVTITINHAENSISPHDSEKLNWVLNTQARLVPMFLTMAGCQGVNRVSFVRHLIQYRNSSAEPIFMEEAKVYTRGANKRRVEVVLAPASRVSSMLWHL